MDDTTLQLRSFQADVLNLARNKNVVMVGETGIGKTFVAIALLSEQNYSNQRRAFFLAPTRQLVWQITAKIKQQSTLRAEAYCGQSMDQWGRPEWERALAITRVVVCTPEVLRNALERGFVLMERINLLVFDECHHVTKRHPYAQVIKLYDGNRKDEMPRVFGTTACPTRDCADKLHAELKKIELDEQEIKTYAAAAPIEVEEYEPEATVRASEFLSMLMQEVDLNKSSDSATEGDEESESAAIDKWMAGSLRSTVEKALLAVLMECKAAALLHKLLKKGRSEAAWNDERCEKLVSKFILTCIDIYKKWGLWCVYKFIDLELERAAINASLLVSVPGSMYGYDTAARRTLLKIRDHGLRCNFAATSRLLKIVELLEQRMAVGEVTTTDESASVAPSDSVHGETDEEAEAEPPTDSSMMVFDRSLQGILFVTTRAECRVVCEYLNAYFEARHGGEDDSDEDDDYSETNVASSMVQEHNSGPPLFACVLGQSTARDTASFHLPRMEETLTQFDKGQLQFLVSTAVSIEGVDFPKCSMIVVADRIPTARKLIQLRGRARHEDGVVYYLIEKGDRDHDRHYRVMKIEMAAINELDFTHDKNETIYQQPRSQVASDMVGALDPADGKMVIESTGAVLDLDSSVSRVNIFCQSLPAQLFTIDYKNMYKFEEEVVVKRKMFRARLHLPDGLGIKPIVTELLHSKAAAKATAAFEACKKLLETGNLDSSLNSAYRKDKQTNTRAQDNLNFFRNRLLA